MLIFQVKYFSIKSNLQNRSETENPNPEKTSAISRKNTLAFIVGCFFLCNQTKLSGAS